VALVLFQCHREDFFYSFISFIPFSIITLLQPYLVEGILNYIQIGDAKLYGMHNGYLIVFLLLLSSILSSVLFSNSCYWLYRFAFKFRSSVMAMIYAKSMRLSSTSRYNSLIDF
jgi:hypothetical protein